MPNNLKWKQTMSNFREVKLAVADKLAATSTTNLFTVVIPERDTLVDIYLNSFDDLEERQYHNCNCCKSFIRQYGNIVAIINGEVQSIWEVKLQDTQYQKTVKALADYIKLQPIEGAYISETSLIGTDYNIATKTLIKWEHFSAVLPSKHVSASPSSVISNLNADIQVFQRSLEEITVESCTIVLDLIAQNSLYRGNEYKVSVQAFLTHKNKYVLLPSPRAKELYVHEHTNNARIRNTAIGTLLVDLSDNMPLDRAVAKFETMVAPSNYKRTTALVTPAMIENAKQTIEELGLTSALQRRYAVESDIPVNQVIFVDRSFKKENDIFATLTNELPINPRSLSKVEEISIDTFLNEIVPTASNIELLLEQQHSHRFMALTAGVDKTANKLFKWNNDLAWAYEGNVADSMKERVKQAGGTITGDLCCRLAWDYKDDLDFHMIEPDGYRIYYCTIRRKSPSGGMLDLDANGCDGPRELPIENIFYSSSRTMKEGIYTLQVNNYYQNGLATDKGFSVEIEFEGTLHTIHYAKKLKAGEYINVAKINFSKQKGFTIVESLPINTVPNSRQVWDINTNVFHKVRLITQSPNYLGDDSTGNKHYFFILDGAKSPEPVRGFFNEYLRNDLTPHRKTFEILADKLKVEQSDVQLAGLGFSITQHDTFIVRVSGTYNRCLKVRI